MKAVKTFFSGFTPGLVRFCTPGSPKIRPLTHSQRKTACIKFAVTTNQELTDAAKSVSGIDVLDVAPVGSRKFAGPYYPDEADLMISTLRGLRNRAAMFVAPDADGRLTIYRKAKTK